MANSSDEEFEVPENDKRSQFHAVGDASIKAIIQDAETDRLTSKRAVKQLQYGHGAPGTRYQQSLWVNRFDAYRKYTLQQSVEKPFVGDDLIRFFSSVIPKITRTRPINTKTILGAYSILTQYGQFQWDTKNGFEITTRDRLRFKTFIDDAVIAKRLLKGSSMTRTWIGFLTLSRMVRCYLDHAESNGCRSWDIVIARCLAVVLVASMTCRSGDVARSPRYSGVEYLKWQDVDLYLDGERSYQNLRATVSLNYVKGDKDSHNTNTLKFLRPLDELSSQHICPIALILTHALRHSLVDGSTIDGVLENANKTPGRRVQWKRPDQPVLVAFSHKGCFCLLDQPANVQQLCCSIKMMGIVSKFLGRAYMHATRLGGAREIAHLPRSDHELAMSIESARQSLGHTSRSAASGLTEWYIGGPKREDWNLRSNNSFERHGREPEFGELEPDPVLPIDPDLLDGLDQVEVTDTELATLDRQLFSRGAEEASVETGDEQTLLEEEEERHLLLGPRNPETSAEAWIDKLSRINNTAGRITLHKCRTPRCDFQTHNASYLKVHERTCNEARVKALAALPDIVGIACQWEGCDKKFASDTGRIDHVKNYHEWLGRPCEYGCDPNKIYETGKSYLTHTRSFHSARWPSRCRFPGCTSEEEFTEALLKTHLRKDHGVTDTEERTRYLPELPERKTFGKQPCPFEGCPLQPAARKDLFVHLVSIKHGMSADDAEAILDGLGETYRPKPRSQGPYKRVGGAGGAGGTNRASNDRDDVAVGTKTAKRRKIN